MYACTQPANLGNYSQESNHGQLFRPSLGSSAWYSLYVNLAAKADSENPFIGSNEIKFINILYITCLEDGVGSEKNVFKNRNLRNYANYNSEDFCKDLEGVS